MAGVGKGVSRLLDEALDMTKAARMKRARDMGFDTEQVWYHGTPRNNIEGFSVDESLEDGLTYLAASPKTAGDFAMYRRTHEGANIIPAHTRGNYLEVDGDYLPVRDVERLQTRLKEQYPEIGYGETIYDYASSQGYDGVIFKNVTDDVPSAPSMRSATDILAAQDPSNIRSVNASFDPAKKESSNLLASLAPAAVGLGALSETDAAQAAPLGMLADESPQIRAPRHPWLFDAAMGARGVQRRLEGSPFSLMFPEGTVNYMERLSMGDKPNWTDRAGALLDFL